MKLFSTILAFAIAGTMQAQVTTSMSLKEALDFAEKNSPVYQNAETDILIAAQTVKTIKSAGLPQINAGAGYNDYIQIPGNYVKNFLGGQPEFLFFRFQQKYSANASIGLNQLLFDGTFFLGLKAAEDYVELAQTMTVKSKTDLHMTVAKAYLLALTTSKNIDLINSNLNTLEKSLKDVSALYDEGFAEKLDVQRLQLAVSNLKVQREKLLNAVELTKNLLKLQMGMDVRQPLTLTDDLETVNAAIPLAASTENEFNVKNRIEHKLMTQGLALTYLDEKRYKMGYLPTLVGFMQHQRTTNRSEFNFFQSNLPVNNNFVPATLWGLNLSVPVFDGFRKQSQIMDVRLRRMKTENDMRNFENAATLEYTNAKLSYATNLKQAAELKLNLDLAKEIYEKTNIKFKEGVGSTLEITQAETELKTAQTNYMNALYDLTVSKLDLKKAVGEDLTK
jgi:outer membrane protein TolC